MIEIRQRSVTRVVPLVLATMTSQALLVVLSPTIAAIADEYGASVAAVGQARTVAAATAIVASLAITAKVSDIGTRRLLVVGSVLTLVACAAVAAAPNLAAFIVAHLLVGVGFACLLTAGFAGVAAFSGDDRPRAIGYVTGANALAWIIVNPLVGALTQWFSWRVAQAVVAGFAIATLVSARGTAAVPETRQALRWRVLFADRSARRWIVAELLGYTCWTGLLTYVGAFFVQRLDTGEAAAGWLLAAGAAAYVAASTRTAGLVARLPRRSLVAGSALVMAGLLPVLLDSEAFGVAAAATLFCLIGLAAGIRTPVSSGLGLDQLPRHGSAMMAIRTGVTQSGYLLGAVVGGVVIGTAGYGALGGVLGVGMVGSALLFLRVRDPGNGPSSPPGERP